MRRLILLLVSAAFYTLGYALLFWRHRDDTISTLGYALILVSCMLELAICLLDVVSAWTPKDDPDDVEDRP